MRTQRRRFTVYNEIVAEALAKKNCKYWFECVRNYLIAGDVWDVVDGSFSKPPEDDDEDHKEGFMAWRKKNAAAMHAILISCGTNAFSHISQVSEAKVAWNVLNLTYNHNLSLDQSELESDSSESEPEPEPALPDGCIASPVDPSIFKPSTMIATCITTPSTTPVTGVTATQLQLQLQPQPRGEAVNCDLAVLYKNICENNLNATKAFMEKHPSALGARITSLGQTALHVAASLGHVRMVEGLVGLMEPQYLEIVDVDGFTPLATAAANSGHLHLAQCMVNKNDNILTIPISRGKVLPVTLALSNGHKEMGRYLYSLTPLEILKPKNGTQGAALLYWCFQMGELGIALDLLQKCQELVLANMETGQVPILKIASMPSAFSNGSELVFWKRWIYNCPSFLSRFISKAYNMLGMEEIYKMKLVHEQAAQILRLLCEKVSFLGSDMTVERNIVFHGIRDAAREGNVEFVVKVSKANSPLIQLVTERQWNIFFDAVDCRQAEVFILIHGLRFKDGIAANLDNFGNAMLHVVANLAPSSKLNRISGPAFQMQSELKWFKVYLKEK